MPLSVTEVINEPLYFLDGHSSYATEIKSVRGDEVEDVCVLRGVDAVKILGRKAFVGVVFINVKAASKRKYIRIR